MSSRVKAKRERTGEDLGSWRYNCSKQHKEALFGR
jgi:hypothetical protein